MRRVIRLGDRTSHGGYVVSATSRFTVMGIDVARLGDQCTCPKKDHNNCYIVEGDPDWTIDGVAVALEGHKLSCGAVLISSMPNAGREDWGGGAASLAIASPNPPAPSGYVSPVVENEDAYDEQAHLNVEGSAALAGLPYYIETIDRRTFPGRADEHGLLPRIDTDGEDEYTVYWGDEALAKMDGQNA